MKTLTFMLLISGLSVCIAQEKKSTDESSAVVQVALDYADGYYSGSAERMERAIHPDFNKVVVVKLSPSAKPSLQYSTYSGLIEIAGSKLGFREPDKRNIIVNILKANDNLASVKIKSPMFNDYLQMVRIDGVWKIVNVLWEPGPETPNLPPPGEFNLEHESQWVITVVKNYYEGSFENDITKVENAVHPEVRITQFTKLPQGGKEFLNRVGAGMIVEVNRAKLRQVPAEQRKVDVNILDIVEKMAFVEAVTPISMNYLQLAKFDDGWKIVNMLSKQKSPVSK